MDDIINREKGLSHCAGSVELYTELLEDFVLDQPEAFGRLKVAAADGNFAEAGVIAHSIKGVAATIGAVELPVVLYSLEKLFTGGEPPGHPESYGELIVQSEAEFDRLISYIKEEVKL